MLPRPISLLSATGSGIVATPGYELTSRRAKRRARIRSVGGAFGLLLGVLLLARSAAALPEVLYGFDLDSISSPNRTQLGFQSVTVCTFAPGEVIGNICSGTARFVPEGEVGAGYLAGKLPDGDFAVEGVDPDKNLWSDGHKSRVQGATLRISGLAPGAEYSLLLFGRGGGPVSGLIKTFFDVDGVTVGSLTYDPFHPDDLGAREILTVPVVVGAGGYLDVQFRGYPGVGTNGALYGLGLAAVPEPTSGALLAIGLLALARRRRAS